MEKRIIRTIIIILAVLIQTSFLAVVFPQYAVPSVILALVISWTIISGFQQILFWVILLGFFLDIFSFQAVGTNIIILAIISYFISFFSRRFLVEHKGWGALTVVFLVAISTAFYFFINLIMSSPASILTGVFLKNVLIQIIINPILLAVIYFPLKKMEEFLSFYDQRIKIK